ncbi:V-set domain-containing T-cell activation inhibitor 1-like [Conger conger]|uniref:V-set domain-containing T-cell activation inhibitor 1-like n=1 Tax=Conger conger TaxID=82655 RepID=UPI002A5A222C|nr:V-set domain-containing T-cell activation inhibitor 1-like [Conger conger]
MIILIFIVSGLIILILSLAFTGSQTPFVDTPGAPAVGNVGEDVRLGCRFRPSGPGAEPADAVSVTWERAGLSGVVFRYRNRAAQLQDQNPRFRDRAQIFPGLLPSGNASLLLRRVELRDAGLYRCSVSAPSGRGTVSVRLRVAAYSPLSFTLKEQNLTAEAQRWYPKPSVSWSDHEGRPLNASRRFFNNSAGIFRVVTTLLDPVRYDDTYTCLISNDLVTSVSPATVTERGVTARTYFTFNPSPPLMPLHLVFIAPLHLGAYYLLT